MTAAAAAPTETMTRRELESKIVARAWQDDDFRRKFVSDPKGQFEEHLGTKLPEGLTITAHEETPDSIHFVIPMKPPVNMDELSDEDLEKVAGGVDIVFSVLATVAAIGTLAGTAFMVVSINQVAVTGWSR